MGQSLDTKAIYGWFIGYEDDVEMPEGDYGDWYDLNDKFKVVEIEAVHWSDCASYFVSLSTKINYEHEPFKIKELKEIPFDKEAVESDFRLLNSQTEWEEKLTEEPQWYCIGQYH